MCNPVLTYLRSAGRKGLYNLDIKCNNITPTLSAKYGLYRLKVYEGRTRNRIVVHGHARRVNIDLAVTIKLNRHQSQVLRDELAMKDLKGGSPFLL